MPDVGVREWLAIGRVIASGKLGRYGSAEDGPLARFETRFAQTLGVKHVLTVSSGTSALIASLVAAGVGPGDEVLVPAYTWIASAAAPLAVGAVPVLVDIDETLTMDPVDIKRRITDRTRAIIPVHMGNVVCDMDAIMAIAKERNLIVIEDACQAVGLRYKGAHVGTIGDVGVYSFNQFKNMNAGEGGAIATNDDQLFARARIYHDVGDAFRGHDSTFNEPHFTGVNMKATEIQGAMLNVQLSKLGPMIARLRSRHDMMVGILGGSEKFRICPHNDIENAAGLHIIFDTEDAAKTFARENARGVTRLGDSSRHIYTNWTPILAKRPPHPRMNPYEWAAGSIDYTPQTCARTLDILARTCRLNLGQQYPKLLMRVLTQRLAK